MAFRREARSGLKIPSLEQALRLRNEATVDAQFYWALFKPAEAALAALELGDGFFEVGLSEVGPADGREVDLGVGDLPEEIVGDA